MMESNGYHHGKSLQSSSKGGRWKKIFVVLFGVLLALLTRPLVHANSRRRFYNSVRAFYSLATMPLEDWNLFYESLDTVMTKDAIENQHDERLVRAWYKVVNYFCDLGNLEKMYIPPLVDPELGLEENQILIENKMALGAASLSWNASYINKIGDTLPQIYQKRYVVHSQTGQKSILALDQDITPEFQQRPMEILDLGCGKGRVMYGMTQYTRGKATGINIDTSQLKNALQFALDKDLWPHTLEFRHGTFNDKLPFDDESADFIYEIGAFTYMIDKFAVFQEIFRVLRPGGAFCYNDWTMLEAFDPENREQVEKINKIKKFSGLIELHQPQELADVAKQAGFEVIWNRHGGYMAKPSSGLLGHMDGSFWIADFVMTSLTPIMPKRLAKFWETFRTYEGAETLVESMNEEWLDVGHIFLIRKPYA